MQAFIWDLTYIGGSSAAAALLVVFFRERLHPIAAKRTGRLITAGLLLVLQAWVALLVASIDFGEARKSGHFNDGDLVAMRWLIGLCAIVVALEFFTVLHSDFAEEARSALLKQLELVRQERNFTTLISHYFLNVVSRKRERLNASKGKAAILDPHAPSQQMAALIQACWLIVNSERTADADFRLRVAYYRRTKAGLELGLAWNGTSSHCVPERDAKTRARFQFDHPEGCLAVAAAKDGVMYRIADTSQAEQRGYFVFFDANEEKTLKSIAALPVMVEGDSKPYSVLVIDTNAKGFFNPGDRRQELQLNGLVENLAHRLQLEERMQALLGGQNV